MIARWRSSRRGRLNGRTYVFEDTNAAILFGIDWLPNEENLCAPKA
jgi:hypothetical protein